MTGGWIKLHRQLLNNPIWLYDPTAWRIFEYFLLACDHKTGSLTYGRKQLSLSVGNNESTTYKAIRRLIKAKMVTQVSNNKFTTVYICNWHKYQGSGNNKSNNQVTTEGFSGNNEVTHYKNKEIRINKKEDSTRENFFKLKDTDELQLMQRKWQSVNVIAEYNKASDFLLASGKKYKDYKAFFRNWLRRAGGTEKEIPPFAVTDDGKKLKSREEMEELLKKGYLQLDPAKYNNPYKLIREEF